MFVRSAVIHLTTVFWGKRHGVQPQNGLPGFSLHFPEELGYGYLRFEGNGKIPLASFFPYLP